MMKNLLLLSLVLVLSVAKGQSDTTLEVPTIDIAEIIIFGDIPEFLGGEEALLNYLGRNIKYLDDARDCNCEGTIFCTFVIDEQGCIIKPKVVKSFTCEGMLYKSPNGSVSKDEPSKYATQWDCNNAPKLLEQEAIRVITSMPKWKAGMQNGKPVRVQYNLPIKFTMR